MRGFPLLNLLLVSAGLLLLAVPLLRLDRRAETVLPPPPGEPAVVTDPEMPVLFQLRFVQAPEEVTLEAAGRPVPLRGEGLIRQGEAVLPLSGGALECNLKVSWAETAAPVMAEVKVAPEGREELEQNVWGDGGKVDGMLRFTWRAAP